MDECVKVGDDGSDVEETHVAGEEAAVSVAVDNIS